MMKKFILTSLQDFLNENNNTTFFSEVPLDILNLMRVRGYSLETNREYMKIFLGKDGQNYLIIYNINKPKFNVYDLNDFKDIHNLRYRPDDIAVAVFDVKYQDNYFTGYEHNESIMVDDKYKRKGIATAIIDFAEIVFKMPYKPSRVLSKEMQLFVKNRFK